MENQETRIAVIGIIIDDRNQAEAVNTLLSQYGQYVIGRMGLPYDAISALSGKLGRLPGVSSKALYSKA